MPTPLQSREFFSATWAGEGAWHAPRLLRRLPLPHRLRFQSSTTWLTDTTWLVHDRLEWSDGRIEHRGGLATLLAPDRIALSYDGMVGGTELHLREDGFTFLPYRLLAAVPWVPVPLLLDCTDHCELLADGSLLDTLDLALAGVSVGRLVLRLRAIS
ncbi:MAG TPA: hypothetical protein VHX88_15185 [Solirubrobacteraceae bacterium]|nr:hypothetical protein [Solirubrobacteraceae bacterium]